jgi:hypothetical protein
MLVKIIDDIDVTLIKLQQRSTFGHSPRYTHWI